MGTVPTQTNKWATLFQQVIALLVTGGEKAANVAIVASAPAFANPFLNYILSEVLDWLGSQIRVFGAQIAVSAITDFQTNGEKSAVHQAAKDLIDAHNQGDPDEIKKHDDALAAAYSDAIHWDGTAPVNP